jgi:twitching motility protein PilT
VGSSMVDLLHRMVAKKASDLHVKVGSPPGLRIDGDIRPQEDLGPVTPEISRGLAYQLMTDFQREKFEKEKDLDFSYAVKDLARFRVNVMVQRGSVGLVVRQIPERIPTADELGLPQICKDLALKPRGLVLVTGPTGSGKSTTLAAMIDYVNANEHGHILTMEDPVEFIHKDKKCFVNQRQIGQDTESFSQALRRALRQDPDVILIGEMRDLETISMAITAAETGHLVFGTLHTTSAISTVDRIIDVFPTEAQQQVRVQLSSTLQGVISQCLVPKIGGGRVAAREILIATDGIRSLIREGKTAQMLNLLQTGKAAGMSTLENELTEFVNKGLISLDDAMGKANRPAEVAKTAKVPTAPVGRAQPMPGAGEPVGASPGMRRPFPPRQ